VGALRRRLSDVEALEEPARAPAGSVRSRRSRSRPGRQRAQWRRGARGAGPGAVGGPL